MYKLRLVAVAINANDKHCNNMCAFIQSRYRRTANETAKTGSSCLLFGRELEWDPRKKHNGYKRSEVCLGAEELAND